MNRALLFLSVAAGVIVAPMADAAIVTVATNIDFSTMPYTFGITPGDTFTFTYDPREPFDPSPDLIRTAGTAAVTAIFGEPAVSFPRASAVFGPDAFPGFSPVPQDTRAPFTLTASDLGLRSGTAGNYIYGYARFAGPLIDIIAFETTPNTPIIAGSTGAVPEPATWGMMILGFGLVGAAMRQRRVSVRFG